MGCSPPGSSVHRISLGKNTGVGCLVLFQRIFPTQGGGLIESILLVCVQSLQLCWTLCGPVNCRLLCPWDSPGKNAGVGCHFHLQGIGDQTHVSCISLHWQEDSLPLSHPRSPFIWNTCLKPWYVGHNSSCSNACSVMTDSLQPHGL